MPEQDDKVKVTYTITAEFTTRASSYPDGYNIQQIKELEETTSNNDIYLPLDIADKVTIEVDVEREIHA